MVDEFKSALGLAVKETVFLEDDLSSKKVNHDIEALCGLGFSSLRDVGASWLGPDLQSSEDDDDDSGPPTPVEIPAQDEARLKF